MTRYLISFDDGTMIIPEEELPAVAEAAHEVVKEAKDADGPYLETRLGERVEQAQCFSPGRLLACRIHDTSKSSSTESCS